MSVQQVSFATNLSILKSIIDMVADTEEVLTADTQHWRDALQISFNRTVVPKYLLNKRYLQLFVFSMDRLDTLGWILSLTLTGQ